MIQANELRIGNLVSHYYDEQVKSITRPITAIKDGVVYFDLKGEEKFRQKKDLEDISPAEISAKWLLNLGFENFKSDLIFIKSIQKHGMKKLVLVYDPSSDEWIVSFADYYTGQEKTELFPNKIKFMHKLQNLYFALTGEELINLP